MKTNAMLEFLKQYPPLDGFIKLNSSTNEVGEVAMNTVYGDDVVSEYTSGDADKEFVFAIVEYKEHSPNYNSINLESIVSSQDFMEWIDQQNRKRNFPNFGMNCEIYEIRNLQNMPNLAGADETTGKYMFLVKVRYTERRI